MPIIPIESLADPRIAHYRNLKDRELDRRGRRFIAEGEYIVRRLLTSDFVTESLLLADRRVAELAPLAPRQVPVYSAPQNLMNEILGLKLHSGVLACGVRKPPAALERIIPIDAARLTLVVCPEIANAENIGSIIRIAAAFGVDGLLLGEKSHDPFWRKSVRVSMGTVFSLPIVHSDDLHRDLRRLRTEWGVQLAATVVNASVEDGRQKCLPRRSVEDVEDGRYSCLPSLVEPLSTASRPPRFAILLGNEAQGLQEEWMAECDRRITIPMRLNTDSLNVSVAAGIFLYHFANSG